MKPGQYDFGTLVRGDSSDAIGLAFAIDSEPLDFGAGATARLQVRDAQDRLVVEWSTAAGSLVLATGSVSVMPLSPEVTSLLTPGRYAAELEISGAAGTHTWLRGPFVVLADIAHD